MTKDEIAKSIDPTFPYVYAPTTAPTRLFFADESTKVGYFEFTTDSSELESANKFTFIELENAKNYRDSKNESYITIVNGDDLVRVEYPAVASLHNLVSDVEEENIDSTVQLMEKPFDPSKINIDTKTPSIDILIKRMSQLEPEIELNTESYFQRKSDLWNIEKQSRLIESILIRFPLPAFYFDGTNKNKWLIVDGLQRLSSIRNFVINKTLALTNLEFLTHLNGFLYDDLDRDLQRIIEETQVVTYIINPGTPDNVKFNIFKRINTGGLILEPQEIRHALNQGEPARFVAQLANAKEFKEATSYSIRTERMLDRDFANRFLAFYLFSYENFTPDLDSFMSRAMAQVNNLSEIEKNKCKEDFIKSMNLNYFIFGKYAFRKFEEFGGRRGQVNKALFDVFSVIFAKLSDKERQILQTKKMIMIDEFLSLLEDETFFAAISSSTSDKFRVSYRFEKVSELIKNLLNDRV